MLNINKEPTTKAGKAIRLILSFLRKEATEHPEVVLRKLNDTELVTLINAVRTEAIARGIRF